MVRCVARFGLEGATLERIAAEAELSRPLIRHHLGNRKDMLHKLTSYVLSAFTERTDEMLASLPETGRPEALLNALFAEDRSVSSDMVMAFAALTARATEDQGLRDDCRRWILEFEKKIAAVLASGSENTGHPKFAEAATGVTAIYFNAASLAPLEMPRTWLLASRHAAQGLLEIIGENA
ncbi:TetR/AcrR family transcriptional regulator [uncultured Roseovarius sp.]|uniref:TetR/AcrR family transcriptional regulator n=1 Tax=uncultured Roseovarius sp. TaxID=293344 RepID=UPI002612A740|nr:TetR/AcrR family transcriptional regulator [uncultured Roseovarius sp.]